jgi:hypothetical protein
VVFIPWLASQADAQCYSVAGEAAVMPVNPDVPTYSNNSLPKNPHERLRINVSHSWYLDAPVQVP